MDNFLTIEIYLDAVRFTKQFKVSSTGFILSLPKETIIDTLLVTRNNKPIEYTVVCKQNEDPQLSGIEVDHKRSITISYFTPNMKWSADHKLLILPGDEIRSVSRFEIAIENGTQRLLTAETIYVVNQHFQSSGHHGYQMKSYGRSEMSAAPRGASSESSSNLMISAPHRRVLTFFSLHPGITRFSTDGQLSFKKTYFEFPVDEAVSQLPAKFVVRLFATTDSPAGNAFFFDMENLDFLGHSTVEPFSQGQDRAVDVSITSKLLANVVIKEDVNAEKSTGDRLVTTVTTAVVIHNMDYFNRSIILTLPVKKHMLNQLDLKDAVPVDGEYQFELTVPAMQREGPKYNMRTTTMHRIMYDYWTPRHMQ